MIYEQIYDVRDIHNARLCQWTQRSHTDIAKIGNWVNLTPLPDNNNVPIATELHFSIKDAFDNAKINTGGLEIARDFI